MHSLKARRAFITGGTAGIGLAVARSYVEAGAEVVIAGRRAEGETIAASIGARFQQLDVGDGLDDDDLDDSEPASSGGGRRPP